MVTTPAEIGWGSYMDYEGPFYVGKIPYVLPANPDFLDMCDAVVTATEGGHYDAINMYDSCILSVGIIQVCGRLGELAAMLAACTTYDLGAMKTAFSQLPVPADFRQNPQGIWQFYFLDGRGFVTTQQQMQAMFLGGSTGLKGQWSAAQMAAAKHVAATFASIWDSQGLQAGQRAFIKSRLMSYVMPRAKATLFTNPDQTSYAGALKAAFVSYAANLPAVADKYLAVAAADPNWPTMNDQQRFEAALYHMVYGSGIGIWPARYNAIHPVLQKLFNVTLPTLAQLATGVEPVDPKDQTLTTVKGVQQFLIAQGYDIGPTGADGIWGSHTEAAVKKFQTDHNLPVDGIVDAPTHAAMLSMTVPSIVSLNGPTGPVDPDATLDPSKRI
jgi:hypothetical protein